jgi:DNA-binding NtrC family response regulator
VNVLIVDDQGPARHMIKSFLDEMHDVHCIEAASLKEAQIKLALEAVDVALVDIRLGPSPENRDGHVLIKELYAVHRIPSIVITVLSEMHEIREAMRSGAYDYILKDDLCSETICPIIHQMKETLCLKSEVERLRARQAPELPEDIVIGTSKVMLDIYSIVKKAALSDRSVLVQGPTGCGKEVFVKLIHRLGQNPHAPFIDLNCSAIPESLMESQLFGHEKGAFTGALSSHEGYLGAVKNGTLFLDEIGDMPLSLQPKLLRVLETGEYRPLGATTNSLFKGRVIAATHRNLEGRISSGTFREDLWHRLNILTIDLPPLSAHKEDIPSLIAHFASKQSRLLQFSVDAVEAFTSFDWPGNVRQLKNCIDRIAVLSDETLITRPIAIHYLSPSRQKDINAIDKIIQFVIGLDVTDKLGFIENILIDYSLQTASGNKSEAARLLGVHRKVIERRVGKQAENTALVTKQQLS